MQKNWNKRAGHTQTIPVKHQFERRLIVSVLLFLYIIVQIYAITKLSITYDEESFLQYGITILKGKADKDIDRFESKLPITAINALPRAVQQLIQPSLKKSNPKEDITAGRFLSLAVTVILGLLIYSWSRKWYGDSAGLISLIFYLLCPNFLAHGILLSSDIYACLFLAFTFFFLSKFLETGRTEQFLAFSVCFALGQISKFSLLHMLPLVLIIGFISKLYGYHQKFKINRHTLLLGFIFIFINWLFISGSHLFYDNFFRLDKYAYRSDGFQNLIGRLGRLAHYVYIPLPSSYIRSIDSVLYFDQLGGGVPGALNGKPYILGRFSTHGFWYYYLVSFLYKVPLPFILVTIGSIYVYFRNFKTGSFLKKEIFLVLPFCYYFIYMSLFYSTQVGIRHILIIFPLLFVFTGFFIQKIKDAPYIRILVMLIIWQSISVGSYFPHFLPYTNELIPDKKNAYKKIADTNLCYREGQLYLNKYLAAHKDAVFGPASPVLGTVIIEVNDYLGIQDDSKPDTYKWLQGIEPSGHIHSQYLIFVVTKK